MTNWMSRNGYEHGRLFHHAVLSSLALIFFTSLTLLILSIHYYNDLSAYLSLHTGQYSAARIFFYAATLPILSLTHSLIQLVLSNRNLYLSPKAMVFIGGVSLSGWLIIASIWTDCEIIVPNSNQYSRSPSMSQQLPRWCAQPVLYYHIYSSSSFEVIFDGNIAVAKEVFAWILTTLYMVYLLCAGLAWRREGKANKDDHGLEIELEEFSEA